MPLRPSSFLFHDDALTHPSLLCSSFFSPSTTLLQLRDSALPADVLVGEQSSTPLMLAAHAPWRMNELVLNEAGWERSLERLLLLLINTILLSFLSFTHPEPVRLVVLNEASWVPSSPSHQSALTYCSRVARPTHSFRKLSSSSQASTTSLRPVHANLSPPPTRARTRGLRTLRDRSLRLRDALLRARLPRKGPHLGGEEGTPRQSPIGGGWEGGQVVEARNAPSAEESLGGTLCCARRRRSSGV